MSILVGILNALLVITSLFLICLILIQRGKGGGLAGAFGGMGGSSAFGTKAGDVFTRVTIYVALFWGLLAMVLVFQSNRGPTSAWGGDASASSKVENELSPKAGGKTKVKAGAAESPSKPADGGKSASAESPSTAPVDVPALPSEPTPAGKSK